MEDVLVLALYAITAFSPAPDPQAVRDAASDARVDETDLLGALLTVGETSPREYLYRTGELERPYTPPPVPVRTVWDALAGCEASGNWASASNPRYKGGLQMDSTFWARYGGLAFAPAPHLASREQQIVVAQRGQAVQGWQAWPVCSRRIGLR